MSPKEDYTQEEWESLRDLPALVGFALIATSPSGFFDMAHETTALAKGMSAMEGGLSPNPLVSALEIDVHNMEKEDRKNFESNLKAAMRNKTPIQVMDDTLAAAVQTAGIVDAKATPEDAAAYKQWVMAIGQSVAEAGKEGFMGTGPKVQVSIAEKSLLAKVSAALGISPAEAPPAAAQ